MSNPAIKLPLGSAFTASGDKPRRCFIACLDVLGFRALLVRKGLVETYNDYTSLRSAVAQGSKVVQLGTLFSQTVGLVTRVPSVVLSDSIYLWADDTVDAGAALVTASGWIVAESLRLGLPVRGGIACGPAIVDEASATFLGTPMVEAYATEQVQEWVGVALHPSAASLVGRIDNVLEWPVPIKRPTLLERVDAAIHGRPQPQTLDLSRAVAWHHYMHPDDARSCLEKLRDEASPHARHKYENALRFTRATPL